MHIEMSLLQLWNARDVVLQRAKIKGIPIVFTSPILSPEARKEIQITETIGDVETDGEVFCT